MSAVPANLLYSKDHEWALIDGDTAVIGITDHAQSELGDIVFVDLPAIGATFGQGDTFGSVEAVKTVAELYAPLAGEVIAINEVLADKAEIVNEEPYAGGWMIKIRLSNSQEVASLLDAAGYQALIG